MFRKNGAYRTGRSSFAIGQDWLVGNLNARREYGRVYDRRAWPPASTFASGKPKRQAEVCVRCLRRYARQRHDARPARPTDEAAVQISADYAVIPMQDILALGKEAA